MSDGLNINSFVDQIMARYDRKKDGVIDMKGNDASPKASENSEMVKNTRIWEGGIDYKIIKNDYSSLFKAADTDGDQKVTKQDLIDYLSSKYDKNQDGIINGSAPSSIPLWDWFMGTDNEEFDQLMKDHPETKTVDYIKDPKGPHKPGDKLPRDIIG
jgi:hypothetical protein